MSQVLPGGRIGILGDGQLGRMLAVEARRMGYRVHAMGLQTGGPAAQVVDTFVEGDPCDPVAARSLARGVDTLTLETEHVPADVLAELEHLAPLYPSASVLETIQDRLLQKEFLAVKAVPQAAYTSVATETDLMTATERTGHPAILKTRRNGYDGRGQVRVESPAELPAAWERIGRVPAVLEAMVDFEMELSVILARDRRGRIATYPVAENIHRRHILHATVAPARVSARVAEQACEMSRHIAESLDHVGVMAVEMFLTRCGRLLVNEVAPRVHNSGHYTLGACITSQFEQHIRAVCGLELGDPHLRQPAVMVNLLGDLWAGGTPQWSAVLQHPQVRLHLYGKAEPRVGRKMGHLLIENHAPEAALELAEDLLAALAGREAGETCHV